MHPRADALPDESLLAMSAPDTRGRVAYVYGSVEGDTRIVYSAPALGAKWRVAFQSPPQRTIRVINTDGRVRVLTDDTQAWNHVVQRIGVVRPDALFDDDFE
jgi:hypothetical protein